MNTLTTLSRSEFTLLLRNRVLLFNAMVMPLLFPIVVLVIGRDDGLPGTVVSGALEVFALFLLVFLVYYNLLSAYATRRDELVLKRLRTGEATDNQILLGPAVPSFALTVILTIALTAIIAWLGGGLPVNPVLFVAGLGGGAAMFAALALITSSFTRNAEAAQITSLPVILVAMAGTSFLRNIVPESLDRIIDLTPMAAVLDLVNLGWLGTTDPESAPLTAAQTFSPAVMPLVVVAAWIVGSVVVAKTHFRWEPRA
ncbi:ABC transporter permease [Rhodococcus sp. BP-252]|uniref:ABC transporter permease n=1 Tax=unclassified Rhodococcus (in: high G+C Gram-positive bacteria) TaxID=192944 RepID=UPI001C9AEBD0|nr:MULTISPECIES: ABC transporter permease [unclassified Rhodococcus (in: high G+C Gram-positive bacteria)]MBY6412675.1 ABC transporter permease [Rhodococcus sp. BP-320]MBY6417527.1 ABC transporter permease [Rhodococcus sp. BP-321]MBY6421695.1 ABC transporter permease [Rhodococcus sp. BP-324]MBY6427434.1 ABC transporter permease [Rhodococcus sp. BP-323]MBY6432715.1 ABC transporter permease [Rhodococcus sp. BP-322]